MLFQHQSALRISRTAPAGAFIDDIQSFPALTFGLPPAVEVMDQQRLALETAVQVFRMLVYN